MATTDRGYFDYASKIMRYIFLENRRRDTFLSGLVKVGKTKTNFKALLSSYCNAHARRKFVEAERNFPNESQFYLDSYKEIYRIEAMARMSADFARKAELRMSMHPHFMNMQYQAERDLQTVSRHSALGKALNYFLGNFQNFIIPVWDPEVELDNIRQERALRNPVIGRKTWYGTHSARGAQTAAIMLTLVESCKASRVNPREFIPAAVQGHTQRRPSLHSG
jgi:transposase